MSRVPKPSADAPPQALSVWLDDPAFGPLTRIGTLARSGLDSVRFAYDPTWLTHSQAFQLDPDLSLSAGDFYPKDSNFGVFLDSCPDRWGQVLMKRRELVEARQAERTRRELRAWDFLLGVQDATRMGALRFSAVADGGQPLFLANEALAAPPLTQLGELQQVALELTRKKQDDLSLLQQWLRVLVAPGASLGGARPKANFQDGLGQLWIAKFPSADDDHDWALREMLLHGLAHDCGIEVALDDQDTSPSLATVLKTAAFYRVADAQAVQICNAMLAVLAGWEARAKQLGLSAEDRAELEDAFATSLPHTGAG